MTSFSIDIAWILIAFILYPIKYYITTKIVDIKMEHTIVILLIQIERFQAVVALPAAVCLLF